MDYTAVVFKMGPSQYVILSTDIGHVSDPLKFRGGVNIPPTRAVQCTAYILSQNGIVDKRLGRYAVVHSRNEPAHRMLCSKLASSRFDVLPASLKLRDCVSTQDSEREITMLWHCSLLV